MVHHVDIFNGGLHLCSATLVLTQCSANPAFVLSCILFVARQRTPNLIELILEN